jgi:hypothetical protein
MKKEKNKQDPITSCLQEINFSFKDTLRLKVREWRKIFHANHGKKRTGVPILILEKAQINQT